jgi:UDP-GlcNAc:undecaprenyl-phosphate GlcNAc-1-phosphate transferase
MPRLGGLAVILGFLVSVIYLIIIMVIEKNINLKADNLYIKLLGFLAGGLVIGLTCFYDDVKGAKAIVKLCAQVIAAIIVVLCGIKIDRIDIAFIDNLFPSWVYNVITVFWIVGITNALNLIDGLDGLSTGISIISCISLLMIFSLNGSPLISIILITALCGSLVGFLPYNFNPAKTFIGDTGSNFLGYSLAIISILGVAKTYTAIVIVAPIIVLALPLFDTVFAIFRRLKNGKSLKAIIQPDAGHLHHKMLKKGLTQKQAVIILYILSATLGMFAVILLDSGIWKAMSFLLIIVVIIALGYKEFFKQKLLTGQSKVAEENENIDGQETIEDIKIKEDVDKK